MKLGGELELKDTIVKTSTLKARSLFFKLIGEMKPEVVIDLIRLFNLESTPLLQESRKEFDYYTKFFLFHSKHHHYYSINLTPLNLQSNVRETPLLAYFDYIFKNQTEFEELLEEGEKYWSDIEPFPGSYLINEWALMELIPNWNTLQTKKGSEWLCTELKRWGEKWNLTDDWCLNFALGCLRKCKVSLVDKLPLPDDSLKNEDMFSVREFIRFWHSCSAWKMFLIDYNIFYGNFGEINTDILPDTPLFKFAWEQNTEAQSQEEVFLVEEYYNPLKMLAENFQWRCEREFWGKFFDYYALRQHSIIFDTKLIAKQLNKFHKSLNSFIKNTENEFKPFTEKGVDVRNDEHFRWLIEFQIPEFDDSVKSEKSLKKIAKVKKLDYKAISYGVENISKIIELKLREAKRTGRPKGVKETKERKNFSHW